MALFTWAMTYVTPLYVTGANGLPVAIRPVRQSRKSDRPGSPPPVTGGLESAKMIGRSVCAAISRTIASVKAPGDRRRPDQHRRSYPAHHFAPDRYIRVCFQAPDLLSPLAARYAD